MMAEFQAVTECCQNCKNRYRLKKRDYSKLKQGEFISDMEGFVCMLFSDEGIAEWMVGLDDDDGMCEGFIPREDNNGRMDKRQR